MTLARSPGRELLVLLASAHLPRAASHRRKERMKGKVRSYLAMRLKEQQWGRHLCCVLQKAAMAPLQSRGCSSKVLVAIWSLWLRRRPEELGAFLLSSSWVKASGDAAVSR